jgi:adenosylcobinamide-GDP ribazoletransferase
MRKEIKIFFTALMFYTRIPCPAWVDHSEEYLNKATRYFPLIGWIIGSISALVLYVCSFVFPPSIGVVFALITGVLLTGAFHEDGFADVCDGFGGGWTTEKILDIMKDSRVGAYGVIGTVLLFALKIICLIALCQFNMLFTLKALVLAHVLSRFIPVTIMLTHEYARADASSKVKPLAKKLSITEFFICTIWLIPAFYWFNNLWVLLVFIPTYVLKIYLAKYFQKWIGGYTGDCLGATQQLVFVITLLFCLGSCKYI